MNLTDKIKIAIYYDNSLYKDTTSIYYFNVLKNQLKLDVTHLLPRGDTSCFGRFDLHFWVDFGEDGFNAAMAEWMPAKDGGKTIYIASDTHLNDGYRFEKAKKFDYVFFNQAQALEKYAGITVTQACPDLSLPFKQAEEYKKQYIAWLPHAAEAQAYPHTIQTKEYDVCFIGPVQDIPNFNTMTRVDALDVLFKAFPNFYFGLVVPQKPEVNVFEDAARKFNQSRVVFNISTKDDVNRRVFEVLCSGSFLLTNYLPTLGELFEEGVDLVTYDSYADMVEKVRYYLVHDEERERIASTGHQKVMQAHTYRHRVETILKTLGYTVDSGESHKTDGPFLAVAMEKARNFDR